jgi:hypothetical protein
MNIIITTIQSPTTASIAFNNLLDKRKGKLWVIGDVPGPQEYSLANARFFPFCEQKTLGFSLSEHLPERHYSRKNLGYLLAMADNAPFIIDTDDDNAPSSGFWESPKREIVATTISDCGWCNVYKAFTEERIWPRGLPLEALQHTWEIKESAESRVCSYIQQGLADGNPDVDAVYRMTSQLPFIFNKREPVALAPDVWCPFNSQNTLFWREAFPLLYLPSYCSFRMTDIWRSFIAQRCLWAMNSMLTFHSASVVQDRNEHSLIKDFEQEIPGYLNNARICNVLSKLKMASGLEPSTVSNNLRQCYSEMVRLGVIPGKEMELVECWISDCSRLLA